MLSSEWHGDPLIESVKATSMEKGGIAVLVKIKTLFDTWKYGKQKKGIVLGDFKIYANTYIHKENYNNEKSFFRTFQS